MAAQYPIQRLLDATKTRKHISTKEIEDAMDEFEQRIDKLSSDTKDNFQKGLLRTMIYNVKRGQNKSAENQCGGASTDYAKLLKLTNQPDQSASTRPSDHQRDRGDQPKSQTKTPAHNGSESKVGGSSEKKPEGIKVDRSRIDANDKGKNINFHMKNNPLIADLSDPNRPTKVAERYSELYDNEWTDAFEELLRNTKDEETSIQILLSVITEAYRFCKNLSDLQIKLMCAASKDILRTGKSKEHYDEKKLDSVREEDRMPLAQYRKLHAHSSVKKVKEDFLQFSKETPQSQKFPMQSDNGALIQYARTCAEISWWMCVQDPPIFMTDVWTTDEASRSSHQRPFDQNRYRAYTKMGKTTKYIVWPCLFLYENGPVLCKGVAQCV